VADIVVDVLGPKEKKEPASTPDHPFLAVQDSDLGTYRLALPPVEIDFVREGKGIVMVQNGQRIPLKQVGDLRYTYQNIFFLTFSALDKDGKKALKLEQGSATLMLKPAEPYKSPIEPTALLAKAIEAQGGAAVIRRHSRGAVHYVRSLPNNGIDIYGIRYRRDAASEADFALWYALNRNFAYTLSAASPDSAVEVSSFRPTEKKTGAQATEEALNANLEADLQPLQSYKSLAVVREDKVGGVPVYVLEKTSRSGLKLTDFISKSDFRVLRRQTSRAPGREEYSDFRTIDGQTIPFKTTTYLTDGSVNTEEVLSITFGGYVPSWIFRH